MFLLWLWYMMPWIGAVVMARLCWRAAAASEVASQAREEERQPLEPERAGRVLNALPRAGKPLGRRACAPARAYAKKLGISSRANSTKNPESANGPRKTPHGSAPEWKRRTKRPN